MSGTRDADRDQPLPTPGQQPVQDALIAAVEERKAYGIRKYGRPLETHNGRDALTDAWEEALDLVTYLTQMRLERGDELPAAERPLSPYFSHPACGFHWHGRDGMDIPMRDGQPVCPRCELRHMADEAQQAEPIVTVHTAPHLSTAAEEALGALVDVAKAQMTDEAEHTPEQP